MKKILILLVMLFAIGGCSCSKESCECPDDLGNSSEVYKNVVSDYSELYSKTATSVVKISVTMSNYSVTGSGVVFFEEGDSAYVLTNAHVVKDINNTYEVEVIFSTSDGYESGDSEVVPISNIYKDLNEDVAVLEIPKSNKYTVASLGDSEKINKGDFVYTIGSPFGRFNYTTAGYISSYNVPTKMDKSTVTSYVIVTNASTNEGNSGGALFNEEGKLIGITTVRYDKINNLEVHEMYGSLPINHVLKIAKTIMTGKTYIRPVLNLAFLSVNEMGVDRSNYGIAPSVKFGVYVKSNLERDLDINIGSIITEVNGVKIRSETEFYVELLKYSVGTSISLTVVDKEGITSRVVSVTLHS